MCDTNQQGQSTSSPLDNLDNAPEELANRREVNLARIEKFSEMYKLISRQLSLVRVQRVGSAKENATFERLIQESNAKPLGLDGLQRLATYLGQYAYGDFSLVKGKDKLLDDRNIEGIQAIISANNIIFFGKEMDSIQVFLNEILGSILVTFSRKEFTDIQTSFEGIQNVNQIQNRLNKMLSKIEFRDVNSQDVVVSYMLISYLLSHMGAALYYRGNMLYEGKRRKRVLTDEEVEKYGLTFATYRHDRIKGR